MLFKKALTFPSFVFHTAVQLQCFWNPSRSQYYVVSCQVMLELFIRIYLKKDLLESAPM